MNGGENEGFPRGEGMRKGVTLGVKHIPDMSRLTVYLYKTRPRTIAKS